MDVLLVGLIGVVAVAVVTALAQRLGASPESFGDLWPCPRFPTGATEQAPRLRAAA